MRKVKIVATLGPSTDGPERIRELIHAGLDVARLNFSHGTHADHRRRCDEVRAAAAELGKPVAVLGDLSGPKIRVGPMAGGTVELVAGRGLTLVAGTDEGTAERVAHSYGPLADEVTPGQRVLLDDGRLELAVVAVAGGDVRCRVVNGGSLGDHKGINLPGCPLSTPALTDKDRADLAFARDTLGVEYLALSFVRTPGDVEEAKGLAGDIPVIAKIEKPEAVERLDEILAVADGSMVARGDLGVEAGHEKVPLIQKRLIHETNLRAKPVITATQMLDSMIREPAPTRAEVSDVATAILDGTDAIMLSGETAVGRHPVAAVQTMACIADEIEGSDYYSVHRVQPPVHEHTFSNAIADGAAEVAKTLGLAAIAVYTKSGRSAALVSAHRPAAEVIAFSSHDRVLRRLALFWGVRPLHGDWVRGVDAVVAQAERELTAHDLVEPGDEIAITFGNQDLDTPFQTTLLKLWQVR